jgi:hypothetical protein
VSSIRLRGKCVVAPHRVEAPDEFGICVPGFRRCDLFDPVAVPEASGSAEGGQPTLGGDSRTGKDEKTVMWSQVHNNIGRTREPRQMAGRLLNSEMLDLQQD